MVRVIDRDGLGGSKPVHCSFHARVLVLCPRPLCKRTLVTTSCVRTWKRVSGTRCMGAGKLGCFHLFLQDADASSRAFQVTVPQKGRSFISRNRIVLEMLIIVQLVNKFGDSYETRRLVTVFSRNRLGSCPEPDMCNPSYPRFYSHFNIIFSIITRSFEWSFYLGFRTTFCTYLSLSNREILIADFLFSCKEQISLENSYYQGRLEQVLSAEVKKIELRNWGLGH